MSGLFHLYYLLLTNHFLIWYVIFYLWSFYWLISINLSRSTILWLSVAAKLNL